MGKYKNDIYLSGSVVLLTAFVEELKALGYTKSPNGPENPSEEYLVAWGNNGSFSASTPYRFMSEGDVFKDGKLGFKLPEQWNEALAAAGELINPEVKNTFNVGDYVMFDKDLYDKVDYSAARSYSLFNGVPRCGRVVELYNSSANIFYFRISGDNEGYWLLESCYRKATETEIAAIRLMPMINQYAGYIKGGIVEYGCARFPIEFFYQILALPKENRMIQSIALNSKVTITIEQIKQIIQYDKYIKSFR